LALNNNLINQHLSSKIKLHSIEAITFQGRA